MANALEAASLVMIPSGYEDGTLGSLKPTDGSGDFTFSRGSNLSATRINEQGYIEKGYENLLLQSNTFSDAAWVKSNLLTPTNGYLGYDGSNDAWKLVPNAGTDSRVRQSFSTSGIITTSFYAKAAEWNYVGIYIFGSNKGVVWSLIDGSVQNPIIAYPEIYSNGENIGNGWWRFSITHNAVSGDIRIWPCEQNIYNGNTPDSVSGIYIQDAMLNQGLVAYPYIETTTAPVAGGILEDMPRLDWSGSCPALLLEPSRTNLITYSEYFGGWLVSPSYTNTTTQNKEGRTIKSLYGGCAESVTLPSAGTYSYSVYAKKDTWDFLVLRETNFATSSRTWFDLANGVVTSAGSSHGTPTITLEGNGWYRCTIYLTASTDLSGIISFTQAQTSGSTTSGTNDQEAIFVDMAQLEEGSYPTSYIPTYGVSQTRLADVCIDAGNSSLFNSTGGVLFFEASALFDDTTRRHISVSDGSTANRLILRYDTTSNSIQAFVQAGGIIYANLRTSNYTITDNLKMAFKWELGNQKLYVNGQIVDSSTDVFAFSQNILNNLSFTRGGTSQPFYGNAKQVAYFPTALSDSECIALTTI